MTLRYVDGFSTYNNSFVTSGRWSGRTNTSEVKKVESLGRFGSDCLEISNTWNRNLYKIFDSYETTWTVGYAFQVNHDIDWPSNPYFCSWWQGGTMAMCLVLSSSGYLNLYRNNQAVLLASGTIQLQLKTWYYLEWKTTFSTGSGTSEVRINEAVNCSYSGGSTGATSANTFYVQGNTTGGQTGIYNRYTDFYFTDGNGSAPYNGYLGDIRILPAFPNGSGNYSDWTRSGGTANYEMVDEESGTYPDGDTTYNQTLTTNAKDTFAYQDIGGTGQILGVQHNLYARKTDAGTRFIAPMSRQSSTDYVSATTHSLADSYLYYTQCQQVNPADSADWEVSDINNAEFGYRMES